jgi:glycosyltransferase involved in cell wall biosynthesis
MLPSELSLALQGYSRHPLDMKIAFIGQKGIPARFGGVEFHVEELARRLVQLGHQVSVYVRSWYTDRNVTRFEGTRLIQTPTIRTKHLDAILHSLTSSVHALSQSYDIIHYHAMGPAFFSWLPKLYGLKVVVTIHALDWQRPKWGQAAKALIKMSERAAMRLPHSVIVVSRSLEGFLEKKYGRSVSYIPNGVNLIRPPSPNAITENYGLRGNDYVLSLGRLVAEKRVDWLIRAFNKIPAQLRLVIAGGDDEGGRAYTQYLKKLARGDRRVLFTGTVNDQVKEELLSNALLYVTCSSLEGLPVALLEAMAHSRSCLASSIPSHREVITSGSDGIIFQWDRFEEFVETLKELMGQSDAHRCGLGNAARTKVAQKYSWEKAVLTTERIYSELLHSQKCSTSNRS